MKITTITVGKKYTYNLGNYSNIQPELWITAEVEEGDSVEKVRARLKAEVDNHIHNEIDEALEAQGNSPKFWRGPRFDLLKVDKEKYAVIIPHGAQDDLPGAWPQHGDIQYSGNRFSTIQQYCSGLGRDWTVADFSTGDFSDLPLLESFFYAVADNPEFTDRYLLIGLGDRHNLPKEKGWNTWRVQARFVSRFHLPFLLWAKEEAERRGLILIDYLDGDLSRVPELRLKPDPQADLGPDGQGEHFDYVLDEDDDDEEREDDDETGEEEEEDELEF